MGLSSFNPPVNTRLQTHKHYLIPIWPPALHTGRLHTMYSTVQYVPQNPIFLGHWI